ncbi:MAG: coproporphyrinogen dehydrogenase HemZ [Clostridiales bacterium]|mgnify:CR=1 FL=1|nr:coproporphyrinogen dehydrogenase HemZ [Clostridiales bacterium]
MHRVRLEIPCENYLNDVQDIAREFSPYLEIDADSPHFLGWNFCYQDGNFNINIYSSNWGDYKDSLKIDNDDELLYKKYTKRFLKHSLYKFLSKNLGVKLPYGSLTGVRPTKLYYELTERGYQAEEYLIDEFMVSKQKVKLIADCVKNQQGIINTNKNAVALFINIPFCPTRCNYCSFISTELFRVQKELHKYIDNVQAGIADFKNFLSKTNHKITSIYIGGGTPTCIGIDMLNTLLSPLSDFGLEFTVEAGRPDTITKEMLIMLKQNNVTRISINPQSFNQKTLQKIGRNHTVDDIHKCYDMAKELGFVVNMDLISGLQGESYQDFCYSVDQAILLNPSNITIHTLSIKRGAKITQEGEKKKEFGNIAKMNNYAYNALYSAGYQPYYMYRQKNTADNLENVGFFRDNCQCKYNIDMMEESSSIFGIGAGAMSKKVTGSRLERLANPKGFREYIDRINSIVQNKRQFFNF